MQGIFTNHINSSSPVPRVSPKSLPIPAKAKQIVSKDLCTAPTRHHPFFQDSLAVPNPGLIISYDSLAKRHLRIYCVTAELRLRLSPFNASKINCSPFLRISFWRFSCYRNRRDVEPGYGLTI